MKAASEKQKDFLLKHCGLNAFEICGMSSKEASILINQTIIKWKIERVPNISNPSFTETNKAFENQQNTQKMKMEESKKWLK